MRRAAIAIAIAIGGCAVGPDFARPDAPNSRSFTAEGDSAATKEAAGVAQKFDYTGRVEAEWWRLFGSKAVDAIVVDALAHNPGVEASRAALERSKEDLRAGYGVFFPTLDAHAGASRQRYNPAPGTVPSGTFNLFTASGNVSYALDIWGAERRALEGLAAHVDAQRYTLLGAQLMLAANAVDAVVTRAAYRAQIDAIAGLVGLEEEQVRITRAQTVGGTASFANVLALQSELASTRATVPPLEQKMDQADHLLATLVGRAPSEWRTPRVALADLTLPRELPVSLPSELVRQRPDVLVAEASLHAANAQIGVATAAMLPSLTLNGSYGGNGRTPGDVFGSGSSAWGAGAALTAPIFHGGTLYHERRAAIDARDEAAALYRQTVLAAFAQVADALRALEHDAEQLDADAEAVAAAAQALRLLQANYQAGIATYLQVLVADEQYVKAEIGWVQAVAQRLGDTVALYVALGGGWWNVPKSG